MEFRRWERIPRIFCGGSNSFAGARNEIVRVGPAGTSWKVFEEPIFRSIAERLERAFARLSGGVWFNFDIRLQLVSIGGARRKNI